MIPLPASEQLARSRVVQVAWDASPISERVRTLARMRRKLAADRELIVAAIVSDTGKPALDALAGDVLVTLEQMRYYERYAEAILSHRQIRRSSLFYANCRFTEHFEPYGTVLVFGPANYPLQLCLVPAITALYAGNAVILKVSERTPSVARAIQRLVIDVGLPPFLLQVICTGPEESADLIDSQPDFVFFTGSSANGKRVAARASSLGIPTLLELGGSDAALVFADCDLERTTDGIAYGAFSNAGQVCVGIKRLFIEQPIWDGFLAGLVRRTARLRIGAGHDGDLGRLPTEAALSLFHAQVQNALDHGANLETAVPEAEGRPIILTNVQGTARLLREEAFGPVLCVQPFTSEQEAIRMANASPFALGASVWTRDFDRAHRVAHALNAANCSINDVIRNIANPHSAFGGNSESGYGRYHGPHGLCAFSRIKTIMESRSSRQPEFHWFPFTRKTYDRLNVLIELRHRPRGMLTAFRRAIHLIVLAATFASCPISARAAHLLLQVNLPQGAHGRVAYLVFDSPNGFPRDRSRARVHGFSNPVGHEPVETIDVGELPPGRYAASVFLDENGNSKLDSSFLGIPREPVGASNNPRPKAGPPHFDDCVFILDSATKSLSIDLVLP